MYMRIPATPRSSTSGTTRKTHQNRRKKPRRLLGFLRGALLRGRPGWRARRGVVRVATTAPCYPDRCRETPGRALRSGNGPAAGSAGGAGGEGLRQVVPGAGRADLDDVAGGAGVGGGEAKAGLERPHPAVVTLERVAVDVGQQAEVGVPAHGAGPPGRLADVPGRPDQ